MFGLTKKGIVVYFVLSMMGSIRDVDGMRHGSDFFHDEVADSNPSGVGRNHVSRSVQEYKRSLHPNANNLIFGRKRSSNVSSREGDVFSLSQQMREFCSGVHDLFLGNED